MIAAWEDEGIGTDMVIRLPGRLPGLTSSRPTPAASGASQYWRDSAAARDLFAMPETPEVVEALGGLRPPLFVRNHPVALWRSGPDGLFDALEKARARGGRIAFDTNFRPRGWPDREVAREAYRDILDRSDIALASAEDLHLLFGPAARRSLPEGTGRRLVLKLARPACRVSPATPTRRSRPSRWPT